MHSTSLRHFAVVLLLLAGCGGGGGGGSAIGESGGDGVEAGTVLLSHQGLAFDQMRQVYYATVSSTDTARGNRVATIDRLGQVTATSPQVGSSPSAIAVSSNGSRLYVGLNGTGEVAQYSLPSFTLLAKLSLPMDPFSGQMRAEQISVSPIDPDVFAVSLAYDRVSPRHAGVAIVRGMTMLPVRTSGHTGSNRIVFGPMGDSVYGFNNETTEFGIRKISLTADGLVEELAVPVRGATFDWDMAVVGDIVMVGGQAFSPESLAPRGVVERTSFHCVGVAMNAKVACFSDEFGKIVVADTTNFTRIGEIPFPETPETGAYRLVNGPSGQVAASATRSGRIYLIDSDALR